MNHRLTVTAAVAVILASVSIFAVIKGSGWLYAGMGAVLTVALAGTVTRLGALPAAGAATVLALVACSPLLIDPAWYWKAAGLVVVAAAAASAMPRRILQVFAGVITYLAALLIYLNVVFAGPQSVASVLPTRTSVHHLWLLAGQGLAEKQLAPPVPGIHGIMLLTAAGIGLMAAVTDLLAVRLRSPAIAGLPLLVLFSVPVATNARQAGVGAPVAFCVGITGYLALLAADGRERLRIWGRLVTVWQAVDEDEHVRGPNTRALAAAGRRIGLAAACLAIIVPVVLPSAKAHGIFSKHEIPGVGGGQGVALPNPLASMKSELLLPGNKTVLTYRTSNPKPEGQYLPVYVLDYDGSSQVFKIISPTQGESVTVGRKPMRRVPGLDPGLVPAPKYSTTITLGALTSGLGSRVSFLPLPYAPTSLKIAGDWQEDNATLMVYSGQQKLSGLKYTVTSTEPDPVPSELASNKALPSNIVNGYLGFTSLNREKLLRYARRATKEAKTPYEKAVALETWFTKPGRFTYNLNASVPNGPAGLLDFLTKGRQGFCQQFAYAMAVLARLLGIPSRIIVGYTAGTQQPNGTWKVTSADAHAWPELYFPNAGWLRFEPTPGGSAGQGTATVPPYVASGSGILPIIPGTSPQPSSSAPNPGARKGLTIPSKLHGNIDGGNARGGGAVGRNGDTTSLVALILAIVLALGAVMPWAARSLTRRRRWLTASDAAGQAHAAWRELRDDLDDYGLPCRASESPRAVALRVGTAGGLDESACQALNRIARAEERASYATVPEAAAALPADVLTVRRAVARQATRAARWRARLWPASTLRPVRAGLQHSLDVFGWLDAAGQKVRSHVGGEPAAQHEA